MRLFERGAQALKLTEEGRLLQARTAAALDQIAAAGEEIATGAGCTRGRLRISAPGLFAQQHLGAFAAEFRRRHPEVVLEVQVHDAFVDLVADDFDAVIRVNPDPASPLVGRRLYAQPFVVAAAPAMARPPTSDSPVAAVTLLTWPEPDAWTFMAEGRPVTVRPNPTMRFSSLIPVRDAVLAGAGAGVFPLGAIEDDLDHGRLIAWGDLLGRRAEVWVLHAAGRLRNARVGAFVAALAERFTGETGR